MKFWIILTSPIWLISALIGLVVGVMVLGFTGGFMIPFYKKPITQQKEK